jgi:hypothetical protein
MFAGADGSAQLAYINPRSIGVEHQQIYIRQEHTKFLGGPAIVGLEHGVAAHPQEAGD